MISDGAKRNRMHKCLDIINPNHPPDFLLDLNDTRLQLVTALDLMLADHPPLTLDTNSQPPDTKG